MTPADTYQLPHVQAALDYQYELLGITADMRARWELEGMFRVKRYKGCYDLCIGAAPLLRVFDDGRIEMPEVDRGWLHFEMVT